MTDQKDDNIEAIINNIKQQTDLTLESKFISLQCAGHKHLDLDFQQAREYAVKELYKSVDNIQNNYHFERSYNSKVSFRKKYINKNE